MSRDKISEIHQKMEKIHRNYGIDQREFGKILVIASTTLLVISLHAVLSFQSIQQDLDSVNNQLNTADAIFSSNRFESAMNFMRNFQGSQFGDSTSQAVKAFQQAEKALETSNQLEENIENTQNTYQWLVLLSIIGIISGITVIYI